MASRQEQEVHGPSSARLRGQGTVRLDPMRGLRAGPVSSGAWAATLVGGIGALPGRASQPLVEEVDGAAPSAWRADAAGEGGPRLRKGVLLADKYRLVSLIGEGGMGTVWRARNVVLDVDVALKVIRREIRDPSILERFMLEARASARLQHPAIVCVYDFGTSDRGEPFMVMELLQGTNLGYRLEMETRIDAAEAVTLLLPIAAGLSVAHRAGVVHRDLKPDNIFLAEGCDGCTRPVLMDFGIAKLRQVSSDRPLTCPDALVGTPEYMSPEQLAADSNVDARSDVWGFCVLLYEVIAGRRPFDADSPRELFAAIAVSTPPSLHELGVTDRHLSDIVCRGLAKRPEDRWSSMHELGIALAQWAADAGMATDAAGVTLVRWSGVALRPRRRARAAAAKRVGDAAAVGAPAGAARPKMAARAPTRPRRPASTGLLAALLALAALGLGGWVALPRPAATPAEPSEGSSDTQTEAAPTDTPPAPAPGELSSNGAPEPTDAPASLETEPSPAPASGTPRPEAPSAEASDAPPRPEPGRGAATLRASGVPATPNF
jgi:serine/threonine-protein kinase